MSLPVEAIAIAEVVEEPVDPVEPPDDGLGYWASDRTEHFGRKLRQRLDDCQRANAESSHMGHVATAYTHYFGQDIEGVGADSSRVTRAGEQGEMAEIRVPQCRSLAAGVVNIVTGAKVAWSAMAVNNDHKSKAAAITAGQGMEYYWKDRSIGQQAVEEAIEAVLFGDGFLFTPWDPSLGEAVAGLGDKLVHEGDIAVHCVSTWDVIRDPTYSSWRALPWVAVVLWRNKYDVAAEAETPELREKVLKQGATTKAIRWTPVSDTGIDADCIPVTYWYHKRTPAVPGGREAIILEDGTLLADGPLHRSYWKQLPVHRMYAGELKGSPYPDTSFWHALGVGQVADSVHTSLATNITTTTPGLVTAESDSEITPTDVAGGPKLLLRKPGSAAPTSITLQAASPEQFRYLETLRREAQQLVGLNSTAMGEPESKNLSGQAMALLSSMSIQNNSNLQGNWVGFIISIGNSILGHLQHRLTTARRVALSGKGRAGLARVLELSGDALKEVDRVVVEIGNPLQQTAAGRLELAQLYLNIPGMVRTPEQIQAVVDTGRLDPLTQDLSNQLLLISDENEMLAEGKQPPVMLTDDHRLHLREHPGVGANREARSSPKVMAALQAHCAEHVQLLRETDPQILLAMGQQPLAPPPPPPGMMPPGALPEGPPPAPTAGPTDTALPGMPTNPATGQPFVPVAGLPPQ